MSPADVCFLILAAVCLAGPYVLHLPPRSPRQWIYIALTIGFLAWLLPLMASVRSR